MKIKMITLSLAMMLLGGIQAQAQNYRYQNAKVVAQNYDISDNLDLQAVASIFGESRNLEDFERRLNDPSAQISNLDLNRDNYVDYLRVIEVADNNSRIIVIQAVLGQDMFQDVATIELEKKNSRSSEVYVQIVGNPYIYGPNYIYEPYYWYRPVFFDLLWAPSYSLYYSPWYWGYYPTYYSYWTPMPVFRYRRHITPVINTRNRYVYSDSRNISSARQIYSGVSRDAYESRNPGRSFAVRNTNVRNRHELLTSREVAENRYSGTTRNVDRSVDRRSATDSRIQRVGQDNLSRERVEGRAHTSTSDRGVVTGSSTSYNRGRGVGRSYDSSSSSSTSRSVGRSDTRSSSSRSSSSFSRSVSTPSSSSRSVNSSSRSISTPSRSTTTSSSSSRSFSGSSSRTISSGSGSGRTVR